MKLSGVLSTCLAISACQAQPSSQATSRPNAPSGCPSISGADVRIDGQRGADFWTCQAFSSSSGELLFDIYVGMHPSTPTDLRYGGVTHAASGDLVWFTTGKLRGPGGPILHTFVPLAYDAEPLMYVHFRADRPPSFEQRADLVSRLKFRP
jgi:hypothetical protein